jgi:4-hydroxybenzoate polyprenyltransferase
MPFAMVGFTLGSVQHDQRFDFGKLIFVVLCMVFARSAAMAFNRWLDRDIDAKNPRTLIREIPSGAIKASDALWFVVLNGIFFIASTWFINTICFLLSPVALLVVLGYSYTKRFTALCHLVLGLGLALAPVGAYLAVTGSFDIIPVLLGISVLFWVAGFDIIYALQDEDFDKTYELNSIPVVLGRNKAMRLSEIFHVISAFSLIGSIFLVFSKFEISYLSIIGVFAFLSLLVYQHLIIKPNDLSRVNVSFFTTNGIASVIFGSLFILDLLM